MSDIGEEIIKRLNNTGLQDNNHPMHKLIDYTIGEWLQNKNDEEFKEQFFIQEATGKYLDLHGRDYNVGRRENEPDDDYRQRIIYESLGHLTVNYLRDVYGINLYVNVASFNPANNKLTSDNLYYTKDGFMCSVNNSVKAVLEKKFVIGSGLTWL